MTALSRRAAIEAALVFVAVLCFFRWKLGQWNGFLDFDGHYHLRVAHWIAHSGLWTDLKRAIVFGLIAQARRRS